MPKLCIVVWLDTVTRLGWHSTADGLLPALSISVGWLLNENETLVHLGSSVSGSDMSNVTTILKSTIIKRWDLRFKWLDKWVDSRGGLK